MRSPLLFAALISACAPPATAPSPPPATAPSPPSSPPSVAEVRAPEALGSDGPDSPELARTMTVLAREVLARTADDHREAALRDRMRAAAAAGDPAAALAALTALRAGFPPADPHRGAVLELPYELHARAMLAQPGSFADAFRARFHEAFGALDDLGANLAGSSFGFELASGKRDLEASLDRLRSKPLRELAPADARALVGQYADYTVYRDVLPLAGPLLADDNARRYEVQDDVLIKTPHGATLSAVVVRPRRLAGRQPVILFAGIYTTRIVEQAYVSAAHGYIGVTVFSRGKRASPDRPVPYEREVEDVPDAIDWIARQPWSDGRVGMYGGSYCGFTQWAATKHLRAHPALKTIVPYVAAIPGQGLPMWNNVFISANYAWPYYVGDGPLDDDETYNDPRWRALPDAWYASGRPYREIDQVAGKPNPWLQRWLAHPDYDAYWQAMVPYGKDFAQIDIPVLTVTGYYDDGQISALRYYLEHTRHRAQAEHYVLIGPYDHFGAQRRPRAVLRDYAIDPVARIDVTYVTFQWLDHVFRGAPLPALLSDKINYEVMGANVWRHVPTIDRMHDELLTLYLDDHHLTAQRPTGPRAITQDIDLADRKTQNNEYYPDPIVHAQLDDGRGVVFTSEPLDAALAIDGMFAGELHVTINKRDFDLGVELYEVTPDGTYFSLSYFLGRASYARDLTTRRLLTPGKRETIPFDRTPLVSRQLSKGSRIVVVLNANKNSFAQVNHGTGKDVSDESVADAGPPLQIRWSADSFVRLPVRRAASPR